MQNAGWMGWFAYLHSNNFGTIHNCEHFLPFHRRFVHDFESVGRRINPAFVLPYWDELRDYANPAASAIFTSNYFGGNGQGANHCVTNGMQANWQMSYPSNHCFARQFNNGNRINAWYSPEYIQSVLSRSSTMAQIRAGIEYSLHGAIHLAVGGDMVQMHSPNDFIFWLHHANIDRLWSVWQGSNRIWTMDGVDTANKPLSLSEQRHRLQRAHLDRSCSSATTRCASRTTTSALSRTGAVRSTSATPCTRPLPPRSASRARSPPRSRPTFLLWSTASLRTSRT
ncbi:Di-copper centre-containing protein [Linderina pennispora]|uniref:Di-copper centre-containing protein n=1 Tax=Linderina pennispora TaxID=61395 RepID=A0A1Y1W8H1_9FUNG|nr:Di-copper centre-containing protein [Linderina pennispora]ORX69803.1 Di-copper centre-containing protein [Linderina pennispora]